MDIVMIEDIEKNDDREDMEQSIIDQENDELLFRDDLGERAEATIGLA
jgi:hypothetical protein